MQEVTEAELAAKAKADRITPELIEANIVNEAYYQFPDTTLTICVLICRNGFLAVGQSACAAHVNFDPEIGRRIARSDAFAKLWAPMGYELRSRLAGL